MSLASSTPREIPALRRTYDVAAIRRDFPILERMVHGKPLVYLDTASTAQRPLAVLNAMDRFNRESNANVHRGVHTLSVEATDAYEAARNRMRRFLNASDAREIIFTRGATESINLVASCWGRANVRQGDRILVSGCEHHSNIVPWQYVRDASDAMIDVIPVDDRGVIDLDAYARLLAKGAKVVAIQHVSNTLGTVHPLKRIIDLAHAQGAIVVVDGAQGGPHLPIDVQDLDADFYAVSGHKMYGPMGVGVLYGKRALLEAMPPWLGGGSMIKSVTFEKTLYADLPDKFEAGTPHVAGAIGLGEAAEYLSTVGLDAIAAHERGLLAEATARLSGISGLRIIGTAPDKAGVLSFVIEGIHPHDIGTILDSEGVAVRTGHHCTQPLMERFGVPATARASFGMYSTHEEVERLVAGVKRAIEVFR